MNKIYQRIDWENYPSSATPLNEDNLNKMDYAIDKLDDRIVTHETTKLDIATGNTLVKNVTFTERTGVFTIEKLNGSKFTINTALEKISINFYFDPTTQKLALTLIDGTVQEIDLSALITQYEFLESDTITFEIDASGKVKANILNGSITGEKLEPNYLANATLQANNAKTSADNAKTSEELAYQYAEEAKESASQTAKSDAKNITYDNTESGLSATNVKDALDEVAQGSVSAIATDTTITDSTNAPLIYGKFKGYTEQDGEPTPDNPVEINGLAKDGAIEVKTTGKNIFGGLALAQALVDSGSSSVVLDVDAKIVQYGYNNNSSSTKALFNNFKENTQYTIILKTKCTKIGSVVKFTSNLVINYTDGTRKMLTDIVNSQLDTVVVAVITTDASKSVSNIKYVYQDGSTTVLYYDECGIFEGVVTADDFEPYTETLAEIDLSEPLYEGDYIEYRADGTGVLHRSYCRIKQPFTINKFYNNSIGIKLPFYGKSAVGNNYSNYFVTGNNWRNGQFQLAENAIGAYSHIYATIDGLTTLNEYETWLNEHQDIEFVYKLTTPQEIELTAEQVAEFKKLYTFEPITNVFCDGEVEIQYYKNTDSGETVAMVSKKADNSVSKSNSLENRLSKSLVSTETINIDSLSLSSGGLSTITSEEIYKYGYTLVGANFFLRGSYAENIIASFTIGGSSTKIYNFAFYNPSDYDISAYGYVDLIYVANSL